MTKIRNPGGRFAPKVRTHDENLNYLCLFCKKKGDRILSDHLINTFCKKVISNYDIVRDFLPQKSCPTCRFAIASGCDINLPNYKEWVEVLFNLPQRTRSRSDLSNKFLVSLTLIF